MAETILVSADELGAAAAGIFQAMGVGSAHAVSWASALVWANLRGIDGHGVVRIPRYLDLLACGEINAQPHMELLRSFGATALLNADRAPGPVGMGRAMDEAIALARSHGIGWCLARNITHSGAVGRYALQAADEGMAALVMTASGPLMAYHGSRGAVVSTNPIAIAMPAAGRAPLLLDMATSEVALGRVLSARSTNSAIPEGWGIDADGQPTTDPHAVKTLLPMSGPKGSGLSLMIECLVSLVAGNPVLAPILAGGSGTNMNGLAVALDLSAFGAPAEMMAAAAELAARIEGQPPAPGADPPRLPGERGEKVARERATCGIPLPPALWKKLGEIARRNEAA